MMYIDSPGGASDLCGASLPGFMTIHVAFQDVPWSWTVYYRWRLVSLYDVCFPYAACVVSFESDRSGGGGRTVASRTAGSAATGSIGRCF